MGEQGISSPFPSYLSPLLRQIFILVFELYEQILAVFYLKIYLEKFIHIRIIKVNTLTDIIYSSGKGIFSSQRKDPIQEV